VAVQFEQLHDEERRLLERVEARAQLLAAVGEADTALDGEALSRKRIQLLVLAFLEQSGYVRASAAFATLYALEVRRLATQVLTDILTSRSDCSPLRTNPCIARHRRYACRDHHGPCMLMT
jgi:hypothetical protein